MKLCIDGFAGYGGFSSAFKKDSEWEVVTLELDKEFRPTIVCDIRYLPLKKGLSPDVLVQSPPCNHFSLACLQFPRMGVKLALELVGAAFEAVAYLKPKKWLIENPRGRLRGIIGKPPQTIRYSDYDADIKMMKTTDFWGNIMLPMVKGERRIKGTGLKNHLDRLHNGFPHGNKYEKAERAKIPMGVSQAVKQAVEVSIG